MQQILDGQGPYQSQRLRKFMKHWTCSCPDMVYLRHLSLTMPKRTLVAISRRRQKNLAYFASSPTHTVRGRIAQKVSAGRWMVRPKSPRRLWDYTIEFASIVRSHMALDFIKLDNEVPETIMMGQTVQKHGDKVVHTTSTMRLESWKLG
jgi:hypothetical protein